MRAIAKDFNLENWCDEGNRLRFKEFKADSVTSRRKPQYIAGLAPGQISNLRDALALALDGSSTGVAMLRWDTPNEDRTIVKCEGSCKERTGSIDANLSIGRGNPDQQAPHGNENGTKCTNLCNAGGVPSSAASNAVRALSGQAHPCNASKAPVAM